MSGLGIAHTTPRQQPAFHLPSDTSSSSSPSPRQPPHTTDTSRPVSRSSLDETDDDAPLPFPTALSRRDFLAPNFHAAEYLSSLFPSDTNATATRHQTLEDLRTELRERSSAISAELLELVNANYTSFLGLGDELKGGEERVEDVRVALLGFRRQVEEVQGRVRGRKEDVRRTGGELRGVRGEVEAGRRMLELDERLGVLLARLDEADSEETDGEEDEGDVEWTGSNPALLTELAGEYNVINTLADAVGRELPFVRKMEERITRCRNTLLLDVGASMKEARKAGEKGQARVVKLLAVYRLLGAYSEGAKILKEK